MTTNTNKIIDTNFQEVETSEIINYTIEEVAKKLNISTTKVNHLIFKLNKASADNNFFEKTDMISQNDFEKLELAVDLIKDEMPYDEVVNYFKNNSHGLIDRETGIIKENLTKIDSQVIAKNVTIEIKKETDKIVNQIKTQLTNDITGSFKEEAMKIAQVSLDAMNQTKDIMLNNIEILTDKMQSLEQSNQNKDKELERLYSKETTAMRNKIDKKQEEIETLKKELELEKSKSLFSKFLHFKK